MERREDDLEEAALEEGVAGLPELVLERVDGLQPRAAGGGERVDTRQHRHDPAVHAQPLAVPAGRPRDSATAAGDGHAIARESGDVRRWHWPAPQLRGNGRRPSTPHTVLRTVVCQ